MPQALRQTLLSARDLLITAGPLALLALVLLVGAYWLVNPTPPKRVVLATGPAQGAYGEFGKRYKEQLAKYGIEVVLRETAGSAENLALLRDMDSPVEFAFVQGGADGPRQAEEDGEPSPLLSLGSLFYEPVWIFYREASARRDGGRPRLGSLAGLAGWRVNIGAPGSGVTQLMLSLLNLNGIAPEALTLSRLSATPAVVELLEGRLDAVAFTSAPESPLVQMLLQTPGIALFDFRQAEAYTRRLPLLTPVLLPRGVIDLARDQPPRDIHLVAPTAMLVAHESAHPALQQLFVQAARAIHGEAGWFQRRGDFPNARSTEYPLGKEAERFYQSGPSLLQRYLPFWLANLVDRMWVLLASLIVVLIPLSRVVPPLYELRVRSRVFRWYGKLRQIEDALEQPESPGQPPDELLGELEALERRVAQISVPLSHADELYALRSHIHLVRKKLLALGAQRPLPA
ncbi:TAXI family TRAP transporter solute-binding subunit [Aquariibacter albus]|uniref:C4-dicarboxylate ABC transporter substrate-binding protein n=1 Tax=Aquariibacter albus TaxID=2759899 RepID=A0A839HS99_9BURK|nr:TAXI family TRAP transporter solute-binding subunit [Aquariibacter albus]MBB1162498.1 C4-dicarboxylate ABC transporter substrate-binding protein [Aquariibacter albus]